MNDWSHILFVFHEYNNCVAVEQIYESHPLSHYTPASSPKLFQQTSNNYQTLSKYIEILKVGREFTSFKYRPLKQCYTNLICPKVFVFVLSISICPRTCRSFITGKGVHYKRRRSIRTSACSRCQLAFVCVFSFVVVLVWRESTTNAQGKLGTNLPIHTQYFHFHVSA